MTQRYCVRKKKDKSGEEEKVRYYAVPVLSGKTSAREMAQIISQRCSLTEGDVMATIIELAHLIEEEIHNGRKVTLDDIGSFYLSATSEGFETPEECTPRRVTANRVCFKADPKLRKNLKFVKFDKIKET